MGWDSQRVILTIGFGCRHRISGKPSITNAGKVACKHVATRDYRPQFTSARACFTSIHHSMRDASSTSGQPFRSPLQTCCRLVPAPHGTSSMLPIKAPENDRWSGSRIALQCMSLRGQLWLA